jgi:hypothetical protein
MAFIVLPVAAAMIGLSSGLSEYGRVEEYIARGHVWPPCHPNTSPPIRNGYPSLLVDSISSRAYPISMTSTTDT